MNIVEIRIQSSLYELNNMFRSLSCGIFDCHLHRIGITEYPVGSDSRQFKTRVLRVYYMMESKFHPSVANNVTKAVAQKSF